MVKQQNQSNKAAVQSTKLNQFPVGNEGDTEFAAETASEAAQAFQNNNAANNQQQQQQEHQ